MTIYAVADKVPKGCKYLTRGKEYEVVSSGRLWFSFIDDRGALRFAEWEGSPHLNGGNWRRVEK